MPHGGNALPGIAHYLIRSIQRKLTCALLTIAWFTSLNGIQPAWSQPGPAGNGPRIDLAKGWLIQSSAKVADKGDAISRNGFQPHEWYPSSIPSTVIAA